MARQYSQSSRASPVHPARGDGGEGGAVFARGHVVDLTAAGAPCNCRLVTSSSRTAQTAAPRRPAGQFERQKVRQVSSRGSVALIVEAHVRSSRVTSCSTRSLDFQFCPSHVLFTPLRTASPPQHIFAVQLFFPYVLFNLNATRSEHG